MQLCLNCSVSKLKKAEYSFEEIDPRRARHHGNGPLRAPLHGGVHRDRAAAGGGLRGITPHHRPDEGQESRGTGGYIL